MQTICYLIESTINYLRCHETLTGIMLIAAMAVFAVVVGRWLAKSHKQIPGGYCAKCGERYCGKH